MTTKRLQHQLTLIADLQPEAQPLSGKVRSKSVELIAKMLVHLVRAEGAKGARDESE